MVCLDHGLCGITVLNRGFLVGLAFHSSRVLSLRQED